MEMRICKKCKIEKELNKENFSMNIYGLEFKEKLTHWREEEKLELLKKVG